MDANGTRYHLLEGPRDWLAALTANPAPAAERAAWDARRHVVTLRHELFLVPSRQSEEVFTPAARRGAGCDRFGHTYWIGPGRDEIRYRPAGAVQSASGAATFWRATDLGRDAAAVCHPAAGCTPDGPPCGAFGPLPPDAPDRLPPVLSGLAVTDRHYLVVGTLDPGGLLLFDLYGGGAPRWLRWPETVPFAPFDLAPVCGGGLWVLDRPETATARLWRLDRDLRVVYAGGEVPLPVPAASVFRPDPQAPHDADGPDGAPCVPPPDRYPAGLSLALASPPLGGPGAEVVAVTALPDGTALLLQADPEEGDSRLLRWGLDGPLGEPASLVDALRDLVDEPVELVGHDLTFRSDPAPRRGEVAGTVYVAAAQGNQSFAFGLGSGSQGTAESAFLEVTALDAHLPMRRFSGKALIEGPDASYYDLDEVWLPLVEVPRPRYATTGRLDRLGFHGQPFDGLEPGCVWHRLFLDACIPPGDDVSIESRTADFEEELERAAWQPEPRLVLRATGSERAFDRLARGAAPARGGDRLGAGMGTWELLFQHAVGRYLELRLLLKGSGRSTPRIGALRVYYPRFSYLDRYLPAAYRQEPVSASFLDRYLANVEGFLTELEGRIAGAETLFDSQTAPAEALDWLATWVGASLDEEWSEARRRLFLAHAIEIYRRRGTAQGLVEAVRLATDHCPDESLFAAQDQEDGTAPFGIRLVESHRARRLPPAALGDPRVPVGPSRVAEGEAWRPAHGVAALHRRYQSFLRQRYGAGPQDDDPEWEAAALERLNAAWGRTGGAELPRFDAARLTPLPPAAGGGETADWQAFTAGGLGFPYPEIAPADAAAWRAFLRQRHRRIQVLNRAWGLTADRAYSSFNGIALPARMPPDGAALGDWFAWATLALPIARSAHRFTVLVPVGVELTPADRRRRLDKVRAVVDRERPAHTHFDVQLYWALFRVGAARVGHDTAVGEGSRFTSIALGAGYLGEGLLAATAPWNVPDRRVVGPCAGASGGSLPLT